MRQSGEHRHLCRAKRCRPQTRRAPRPVRPSGASFSVAKALVTLAPECGAVSGCGQDGAVTTVPMYPSPLHKKPFSFTCRCPVSLPDAPLVLGFCRFLGIFHVDEPIICSQGWFCFFSDDLSVLSRCVPLAGPCRAGRWSTGRERGGPATPGREATGLPRLVWPAGCCGRCSPNRGERPPLLVL